MIQNIHSIPGHPDAVPSAPGNAAQPRAFVHTDHRAVILSGVITHFTGFRAGMAVDKAQSIHLRILGNIPCLGMRQYYQGRHRSGGRHAAEGAFQIITGDIPHVPLGGGLGIGSPHLVRVGHPDVETAEVSNGLGGGTGEVILEVSGDAGTTAGHALGFFEDPDVGAIAQQDQASSYFHIRSFIIDRLHGLLTDRGGDFGNRASFIHHGSGRNAFSFFQFPHRVFRHRKFTIHGNSPHRGIMV